jgi:acetylornithine deacetylase/succinyl-diaminopimelate desuccinylase-like protein
MLLYGHYDVQPAESGPEWRTAPFLPTIVGDRLYGRGSTDDKGPLLALIGALESMLVTHGALPVNVECLFDGEDEIGSPALLGWLSQRTDMPPIDTALIADSSARALGWPALVHALRGSVAGSVTIRGLDHDVHAGAYGGGVPDAARELARLLATLHDRAGSIVVAGLHEGISPPGRSELARIRREGRTDGEIRAATGARTLAPDSPATSAYERSTLGASITIIALTAGDQGSAPRNVVPASATARLDVRLAPRQDPVACAHALERHLRAHVPADLDLDIRLTPKARPLLIDPEAPLVRVAARALSRAFGHPCAVVRSGGAVPVAERLECTLGIPTLLLGTSPPESGMHGPNEFLHLPSFHATVHAVIDLAGGIPRALRDTGVQAA